MRLEIWNNVAPKTFRILISLFLFAIVKRDNPNNPRQAMHIAIAVNNQSTVAKSLSLLLCIELFI